MNDFETFVKKHLEDHNVNLEDGLVHSIIDFIQKELKREESKSSNESRKDKIKRFFCHSSCFSGNKTYVSNKIKK
jgi:intein/homing endonuclease